MPKTLEKTPKTPKNEVNRIFFRRGNKKDLLIFILRYLQRIPLIILWVKGRKRLYQRLVTIGIIGVEKEGALKNVVYF